MAGLLQVGDDHLAHGRVVVDDEDGGHATTVGPESYGAAPITVPGKESVRLSGWPA